MSQSGVARTTPLTKRTGVSRSGISAAAVVVPFTPTKIAGLAAWYDASQITGLADGAAVASWSDLSGGGFTLTQGTAGLQPTYYKTTSANLINGLPAVLFTSASLQYVAVTSGATVVVAQPNTVFAIATLTSLSGGASAGNGRLYDSGGATRQLLDLNASSHYEIYAGSSVLAAGTPATGLHQLSAVFSGTSSTLRVDGATVISTGSSPGANGITGLQLGGTSIGGPQAYLGGSVGEFIVYSGALTGPQIAQVESYLTTKWG